MVGFHTLNHRRAQAERDRIDQTAYLMSEGLERKEIAFRLGVTTRTFDKHLRTIRDELGGQAQ